VLLVDDETDFRKVVAEYLSGAGFAVTHAASTDEALPILKDRAFDVVISDLRMPGRGGMDLLREAASRMPDCVLLVLTAYGSIESAIDSIRIGVHDFLLKPVDLEALRRKIDFYLRHQAALSENRFLRATLEIDPPPAGLVGASPAIEQVRKLIQRVAPTDSTVLVTGETGTGKELVARAVHHASPRHAAPFVAVNCGSIPETLLESELFGHVRGAFTGAERDKRGLFEVAGPGTIFLDEVGELPLALQPKILRTIETREVMRVGSTNPVPFAARVVAATHRDLLQMSREGTFRPDLFYRLNVFEIQIAPLRERPQDVPPLAYHLLERLSRRMNRPVPAIEPEALRLLELYVWPGNVRELANVLERALILADGPRVTPSELPGVLREESLRVEDDLRSARAVFEQAHVLRVLQKYDGDKPRAAEALGIDLSSLYRKLEGDKPGA